MKRFALIMLCALSLCACGKGTQDLNILDCAVNISGEEFKVPMECASLSANGWELYDDNDTDYTWDSIMPGGYSGSFLIEKGDVKCRVEVVNYSKDSQPFEDCHICYLAFGSAATADIGFSLPGGIESGKATRQDIIAIYGEPDDGNPPLKGMEHMYPFFEYRDNALNSVKLAFDEDGLLASISMYFNEIVKSSEY